MRSILTISGMVAVHSRRAVFTALSGVPGVKSAEVELGRAVVEHDGDAALAAIPAAIESVGCTVTSIESGTLRALPVHATPDEQDA